MCKCRWIQIRKRQLTNAPPHSPSVREDLPAIAREVSTYIENSKTHCSVQHPLNAAPHSYGNGLDSMLSEGISSCVERESLDFRFEDYVDWKA